MVKNRVLRWFRNSPARTRPPGRAQEKRAQPTLELLEERELLSFTPADVITAYDQGIQQVQTPLGNLVAHELGQQLPLLQQTFSNALGMTGNLEVPFQTQLPLPSTTDFAAALAAVANQLQQLPGFSVQYWTTPQTGTNDMLLVTFGEQATLSAPALNIGGTAEFSGMSYLGSANVSGQLAGSLAASGTPTAVANVVFGVDVVNGTPAFFLSDSSSLSAQGLSATGTASGRLTIGDLADVQASGTVTASLQGSLGFAAAPEGDHKLRVTDLSAGGIATGGVRGQITLGSVTFQAQLSLLPALSWSGSWSGALANNAVTWSGGPSFNLLNNGLATLESWFSGDEQSLNLLGEARNLLGADNISLPFVGDSITGLLGDGGWGDTGAPQLNAGALPQFLQGDPTADLVTYHLAQPTQTIAGPSASFTLFSFGIPILADVSVGVSLGINSSYSYSLDMGVDCKGLWIRNTSGVQATISPYGSIWGSADLLAGLASATIAGTLSLPVCASLGVSGSADSAGKVHVQNLLSALRGQLTVSEDFSLTASVSALWGLISGSWNLGTWDSTLWSVSLTSGTVTAQQYGTGNQVNYQLKNGELDGLNLNHRWIPIDQGVVDFVQAADNSVYYLKSDGTVWRATGWPLFGVLSGVNPVLTEIDSGVVRAIAGGPGGNGFYLLDQSGNIYLYDGSFHFAGGNVRQMVQPANLDGFYELTNDGSLYYFNGTAALIPGGTGIQSFASPGNGSLDALFTSGNTFQRWTPGTGWSVIASGVQSFAETGTGQPLVLFNNGWLELWSLPPSLPASHGGPGPQRLPPWSVVAGGVQSVSPVGRGTVDILYTNQLMVQLSPAGSWTYVSGAQKYAVATSGPFAGYQVVLTADGFLEGNSGTGFQEWDPGIQSFAFGTGNFTGDLFDLTTSDNLREDWGNGFQQVTGAIQSFGFGTSGVLGGYLVVLTTTGALKGDSSGFWVPLDTGVQSFAFGTGNFASDAFDLTISDTLKEDWGTGFQPIDYGIKSFACGTAGVLNGYLVALTTSGVLKGDRSGYWVPLDTGVQSFAFGTGGFLAFAFDLTTSGTLKEDWGTGFQPIDYGIKSFACGTTGAFSGYLVVLTTSGVLEGDSSGYWIPWDNGVTDFALSGVAMVDLNGSGVLKETVGNGFVSIQSGVTTMATEANGWVYVLTAGGQVSRLDPTGAWTAVSNSGINSIAGEPNNWLYLLTAGGALWRIDPTSGWTAVSSSGINSIAGEPNGWLYLLTTAGALWRIDLTGSWTAVSSSGINSIAGERNGWLYLLTTAGALWRIDPTGTWTAVSSSGISAIAGEPNGWLYLLTTSGALWRIDSTGSWTAVSSSGISSIAGQPNGWLYLLTNGGALWRIDSTGTWTAVSSSGISSLAASGSGVDLLTTNGQLWQIDQTGAWSELDTGVQAFLVGAGKGTVDVLEAGGTLRQYSTAGWTLLDQNVQSISLVDGGYTLDAWELNGNLRQFSA
jgi:hypothetical protein